MTDHSKHENSKLPDLIEDLTPHDHLCLIYENRDEWQGTVAPFILSGLKRDEKCIQIVDANTTQEVKTIYEETGISVEEYESKGQLTIIHEKDTYTREGYFDPDLMINLLIEETEKALQKGYYALRIAGEMSWTLRGYSDEEKVLEYEARLNKELFYKYPCVSLCMYDRRKFDPKTIKEVVMTHPFLIMGNQIYRNFYYLEPEHHLDPKKEEHEVQYLLNNLEQQRKAWENLRESEEKYRRLFETMAQGVIYQAADGKIISANPAAERILGITLAQMQGKTSMDPRWKMIKEDGTPVPGEEHPAMIALKTHQTVGPVTRGVFHPDKNSHIWLNITAIPLFQPGEEKPYQAYATFEDITERKQAEEAVEEEFKLRTALLDNIPNCIALILKKDTREIVASNKAGQEIGAVPGKKCYQECALRDNPCPFCMAPELWKSSRLQSTEVKYGETWYQGIWAPLSDDLYVHYIFDITDRKQAEEAMQKRLNELEKLTEISSTIRTAGTLDEMLTMLIDETLKTLDTDTGAIWLNYPSSDTLHFIRARGWVEKLEEEDFKPDLEQGIIKHVFQTKKPYLSDDIAKDPLLKPVAGARIPEGESGIFVPLLIENEPAGVLFVSVKLPRKVDTEEYNLLVLLADMAGTAIHRLNLHEEILRQLHWLEATNAVDIAISSSRDLRLTLDLLLNYIITQTEANAACIHLYDSTSKTLNYTAGRGFRSKKIEEKEFKLGESCPGKAALERQMYRFMIEDDEAAKDKPWASILKAGQYSASTSVPLIAKGEVKGVLSSFHSQPLNKDSSWFNFMEALALQAAIAIDTVSLFEGLQRSNQELEAAYEHTIEGWGQAMELRDYETNGHTRRVADITVSLARMMGVEEKKLDHIRRGALLHDTGKIGIPDSVLFKPGKLTEEEWETMRRHPVMAYQMLSSIEYLRPALNIPYYHHERYDGSGYPHGLKGDEIPLEARIFAVIDVYDALTSDRPYRKAWTKEQAITYIREQSGKLFDQQVVEVFLKTIIDNENGDD